MQEQADGTESAREVNWDRVYSEQLPRVYNFFRFRVPNRSDAEDLTSRTFEKAWQARHRYRRDLAGFSTWLLTIARNLAVDHLRTAKAYVSLDAAAGVIVEQTPEREAADQSDVARLVELTANLPDRDRELLALKYGAAVTNRQIAALTGLSESNVGTLLSRAVEALRARW